MDNLAGKVAVVTGGASGIGLALARRFGAEGMKVVIGDVQPDALEEAAKDLAAELGEDNVLGVVTDVRDPESVDGLAAATFERFDTAHVVCNNAGIGAGGLTWEIPLDRWRWIVEVNLLGVVHGIRSFVPRLVEQGEGHVVNTASVAGFISAPAMSAYCATKHAVVALTESLYLDLQVMAGGSVGASVLCPEWVRTQIGNPERLRPADVSPLANANPAAAATETDAETDADNDNPDSEAGPGMQSVIQALVDNGMEPAAVADKVLDAITTGRFWVFTHDTSLAAAQRRWDAVAADATPVFWGG